MKILFNQCIKTRKIQIFYTFFIELPKKGMKKICYSKNVKTFSVHTDGKPMFILDEQYIFFNHYVFLNKQNRGQNITNPDSSILRHLKYI